jgi:hypothetical protein
MLIVDCKPHADKFQSRLLWLFIQKSTINNSVLVGQHLIQQLPQCGTATAVRN